MSAPAPMLSAPSCRAARSLLKLTQAELAERASVSVSTLRRFETGEGRPSAYAARQILEALEREGVIFVGYEQEPKLR